MNIAILDKHELMRLGLCSALQAANHIVTIHADSVSKLFDALKSETPCELLILDISTTDDKYVDVVKRMRKKYPDIRIIVYDGWAKKYILSQFLEIGIHGFINQNCTMEELSTAITTIAGGTPYWSTDANKLIKEIKRTKGKANKSVLLSKREIQVIRACCHGMKGKDIAIEMDVSPRTVNAHKTHIFHKLGLRSSMEMVRYALEYGII